MDFRWIAGIALWTFLSGPAIGPPAGAGAPHRIKPQTASQRAATSPDKRATTQTSAIVRDYWKKHSQ